MCVCEKVCVCVRMFKREIVCVQVTHTSARACVLVSPTSLSRSEWDVPKLALSLLLSISLSHPFLHPTSSLSLILYFPLSISLSPFSPVTEGDLNA